MLLKGHEQSTIMYTHMLNARGFRFRYYIKFHYIKDTHVLLQVVENKVVILCLVYKARDLYIKGKVICAVCIYTIRIYYMYHNKKGHILCISIYAIFDKGISPFTLDVFIYMLLNSIPQYFYGFFTSFFFLFTKCYVKLFGNMCA